MPADLTLDSMLRSGYLPEVLPPVFTTTKYADFVASAGQQVNANPRQKKIWTKVAEYSATKRGNQRRTFGFPHPETFHDLALFISEHWKEILTHCLKSGYSRSTPEPTLDADRAIAITPHSDLAKHIYTGLSRHRYTVISDISRFYYSIYSHSISWSIHGKDVAKGDIGSNKLRFAKLDELVRSCQDGQSTGLPVGPDTSRIIAEVVACGVDEAFAKRYPKRKIALIRHVDDIWIGADTVDEAEELLYAYRECLREFGLDINDLKTFTRQSVEAVDPTWPLTLKLQIKNEYSSLGAEDRTKLLAEIFRTAEAQRDDGVIKFAIRRFDREQHWGDHWDILEAFLIRSAIGFPHSIDFVARVVAWAHRRGERVQFEVWREMIIKSLDRNSRLGNGSEVCWLLWLTRELKLTISSSIIDLIVGRCGVFPIVMLFHYRPKSIRGAPQRQKRLVELLGTTPFRGSFWLLAYEAYVAKWLPDTLLPGSGMGDFMMGMANAGVSFFDVLASPAFMDQDRLRKFAIEDLAGRYRDGDEGEEGESDDSKFEDLEF